MASSSIVEYGSKIDIIDGPSQEMRRIGVFKKKEEPLHVG